MFIRVLRPKDDREMLLNVGMIWKIEVEYAVRGQGKPEYWKTTLKEGSENPETTRFYRVFVGSETVFLVGDPDDPVIKVLEDIYKSAVKA